MEMVNKFKHVILLFSSVIVLFYSSNAQNILLSWDFEEITSRTTLEKVSGIADTLEGNFRVAEGIKGNGLRLDGFTTNLKHTDRNMPVPGDELTVEAWVSLANYPWNWCPVLSTESNETKGYRLMIGPHGQASMQVAIGEQWISASTERLTLPLTRMDACGGCIQGQ
jgi:hypothetical protein